MTLKHFVFCLCVAATYALVIEIEEKVPENNPDLNRKSLGAQQDAWKIIKDAVDEYYYLVYATLEYIEYKRLGCMRMRTYALNHTLMSGYYTLSWYERLNATTGKVRSRSGDVKALKQKYYDSANVMRFWYHGARLPYVGSRAPNGSYIWVVYSNDNCMERIMDRWWRNKINHSDSYVVFQQSSCYITRQLNTRETCEFWLSESYLNQTLEQMQKKENSEEGTGTGGANNTGSVQGTTMNSTQIIFKTLPKNCRLAFLLNCGYPTIRTYDKNYCDKLNETDTS